MFLDWASFLTFSEYAFEFEWNVGRLLLQSFLYSKTKHLYFPLKLLDKLLWFLTYLLSFKLLSFSRKYVKDI